jgi:hypothetical protein
VDTLFPFADIPIAIASHEMQNFRQKYDKLAPAKARSGAINRGLSGFARLPDGADE